MKSRATSPGTPELAAGADADPAAASKGSGVTSAERGNRGRRNGPLRANARVAALLAVTAATWAQTATQPHRPAPAPAARLPSPPIWLGLTRTRIAGRRSSCWEAGCDGDGLARIAAAGVATFQPASARCRTRVRPRRRLRVLCAVGACHFIVAPLAVAGTACSRAAAWPAAAAAWWSWTRHGILSCSIRVRRPSRFLTSPGTRCL